MFGPITKNLCFSVNRDNTIVGSVSGLLNTICPFAVAFAVIFVIVNPVNGKSFHKTGFHIIPEIFKFEPPLADFYAPIKVTPFRLFVFWAATPKHSSPPTINWMPFVSERISVAYVYIRKLFGFQTPTRFGCSPNYGVSAEFDDFPTIALEHPCGSFPAITENMTGSVHGHQPAKMLARNVP